jgi:hypothetical protein
MAIDEFPVPMGDPNGPGWTVDSDRGVYFLWAPQGPTYRDGLERSRPRTLWMSCYEPYDTGVLGSFTKGDNAEYVLSHLPADDEGQAVKALLLAAVVDTHEED